MISQVFAPIYEELGLELGKLTNQLAEGIIGDGEAGVADAQVSIEDRLEAAKRYLEQVKTLQETIGEIGESGELSTDIWKNLLGIFDPETLQEMLDNATDEMGNLDMEAFLGALQERMSELLEDQDALDNLRMLGIDPEKLVEAGEELAGVWNDTLEKIADATDAESFGKIWDGLADSVKESMLAAYPEIQSILDAIAEDSEDAGERAEKALKKIQQGIDVSNLQKAGRAWEDLADVLEDIEAGGSKASKAIAEMQERTLDAATAMGALEAAQNGDADALEYLASMTGLTAESLANDMTVAEYAVAEAAEQAGGSMAYMANMLYTVGAITIDPSGKIAPIGNIQAAAEACGMTVAQLAAAIAAFNGSSITWSTTADGMGLVASAKVNPIRWSGSGGGSSRRSGGGGGSRGGGGGGGGSASVSEDIKTLLEGISKLKEIQDYRRELAQLAQSYYEARGELQGVILYLGEEKTLVEEATSDLREYVSQIEAQIEAKRAIITSEKEGSKAYKQAMVDLEGLQEKHQEYSKELLKNQTDVENLTKKIKEQNDAIRQMEIDLRDTVLSAIEDREAANERMLSGRIEMENEILDLIQKRYERERDEILETENAKKDALEEEKRRIDELLEERKKLADQEDKMKEIADLEAKIMRISADPTRQKEAMTLREKLAKLREDMAWEAAEAEAEAQKKSIDQQITSIEEYVEYVQDYYEELFKHPDELIKEMKRVIGQTDDEIIAWLKENSDDYAKSTEATQTQMVNAWQDTLDDMRDIIRTYWDEVETIIAGGADNIIGFLTQYSQKYREAGKLQAEAYVDEWRQQLTDLENAYKKVTGGISSYNYVQTSSTSGGGGSGGSGGGSSGRGTSGAGGMA